MRKPDFGLIETLRFETANGFLRLEQHLQRLQSSAKELGFICNADAIRTKLQAHSTGDQALRVRLCLTADGEAEIITTPFQPLSADTQWIVAIAKARLNSADPLLRHKTTRRVIYETARAEFTPMQADEVLLLNEKDELCEGTITSLFVDMGDGQLLTPPLECGLLNGVLRQELLQIGKAKTAILTLQDLQNAKKIFVGNALRGMIPARLAAQT
ncbi:aminotransferase class IV family protein [Pseudochrobactrum asaccharolyticum]|uniref:aminotransferase class IV family protein n=1 Tax=Pseudochrobactrum asaccharolyticum TaxID=354351 RepID=UPI004041907A